MRSMVSRAALALALAAIGAVPVMAQQATGAGAPPLDASPFGMIEAGDPAAVTMPKLAFTSDGTEAADFDKYYAFHRAGTDYATAFADISECDGYARGLQSRIGYMQTPYPYAATMTGAVGGMIGNAIAAAVFGSGEKRRLRRVNMRTCMNFKGYDRYGLPKALWEDFNFEEGLSGVSEEKRLGYLRQQALVAASGDLQGKVLGL